MSPREILGGIVIVLFVSDFRPTSVRCGVLLRLILKISLM